MHWSWYDNKHAESGFNITYMVLHQQLNLIDCACYIVAITRIALHHKMREYYVP